MLRPYVLWKILDKDHMDGHDIPLINYNVGFQLCKVFFLNDYVEETLEGI